MKRLDPGSFTGKDHIDAVYELQVYLPVRQDYDKTKDLEKDVAQQVTTDFYPVFEKALFNSEDVRHLIYTDPKVWANIHTLYRLYQKPSQYLD